jgi:hypothetical protein
VPPSRQAFGDGRYRSGSDHARCPVTATPDDRRTIALETMQQRFDAVADEGVPNTANMRWLKRNLLATIMIYRWDDGMPRVYQLRYAPRRRP